MTQTLSSKATQEHHQLMEIAISGVFYGLGGVAEKLFAYLEQSLQAEQLIGISRALSAMSRGDNGDALLLLEKLCERYPNEDELLAVQALAAKRAGQGDRADKLLAKIHSSSSLAGQLSLAIRANG